VQTSWIDCDKLANFIVKCQDKDDGGISDRPGNMADIFHTYFGICGLLLLGYFGRQPDAERYAAFDNIDPTYALPTKVVKRLGLKAQTLADVQV
jgi:geranylgeranyl transferase type-2 subunit beta